MQARRVEVALRVRPALNTKGPVCVRADTEQRCVAVTEGDYAHAQTRVFSQDHLFDANSTNRDIFEKLVLSKMSEATPEHPDTLCFLAYGHTSSGKTHSIGGSESEPGILTYCVEELLRREGVVEVSMLEVYMDTVQDLLAEGAPRRVRRRRNAQGDAAVVVEGLTTCTLTTLAEWSAVSNYGMRSRRTAPTAHNARSSRSHAIFSVRSNGVRLCLVDLAGSERQTVFSPQLNQESISINKSLSRLSTVLEALSKQKTREDGSKTFVNFRDTTLTVLLQRYLSGASLTTFLACVHPSSAYYQETISTLRYIQRLKKIRTSATVPGTDTFELIQPPQNEALLSELADLRRRVQETEAASKRVESQQQQRIDELEAYLEAQQRASREGPLGVRGGSLSVSSGSTSRIRDTRRVAGWLLTRVLGDLPRLNVGYDEYFDDLFPPTVQVIGYVSTMACLPPRTDESRLAFLDVGDFAMGLSMVDAGIPPLVRLHRAHCEDEEAWEATDVSGASDQAAYVLTFFAVNADTVDTLGAPKSAASEGDDAPLPCCGGYVSAQPLLPLATVLAVRAEATDDCKEAVLQRLVSLQAEQEAAIERRTATTAGDGWRDADHHHRILELEGSTALEGSAMASFFGNHPPRPEDTRSSSETSALAKEVVKQAQGVRPVEVPFAPSGEDDVDDNFASQTVNIDATSDPVASSAHPRPATTAVQEVAVHVPPSTGEGEKPSAPTATATPPPTNTNKATTTTTGEGKKPLPEPKQPKKSKKEKGKDKSTGQGCQCVVL